MPDEVLAVRIMRALRQGLRESLTLASHLGYPVGQVNAELQALRAACQGCLVLAQPYADEPRLVITVQDWSALQQLVTATPPTVHESDTTIP